MKKILFVIVVILATSLSGFASDDLSSRGISVRKNIMTFLREQGYVPSLESDGDISFKSEGKSFYVSFQNFGDELYVETYGLLGTEDSDHNKVLAAANKAQKSLKFVRCDVSDTYVSFGCVQLISSVAAYEHTFSDFMLILSTARERILEYYSE